MKLKITKKIAQDISDEDLMCIGDKEKLWEIFEFRKKRLFGLLHLLNEKSCNKCLNVLNTEYFILNALDYYSGLSYEECFRYLQNRKKNYDSYTLTQLQKITIYIKYFQKAIINLLNNKIPTTFVLFEILDYVKYEIKDHNHIFN